MAEVSEGFLNYEKRAVCHGYPAKPPLKRTAKTPEKRLPKREG